MRGRAWAEITARVVLTIAALLPYRQLLTFNTVYVTDDYFASDIFNGELPGRVLIGDLIRHGELPLWTSKLCSGIPLVGGPAEPIGLAAFAWLPPAAALDLLVIVLLLVAAHGAYGLARRFDIERPGAVLAGVAFAGSGFIACQLKHLSIISTIVWLPVGLELLDRAFGTERARPLPRRALLLAAFGFVFAEQVLAGFPQSAYICGLAYSAFAVYRACSNYKPLGGARSTLFLLGGFGLAAVLGGAAGAVVLLPVSELGKVSDRSQPLGFAWSTMIPYWPPNFLTFLVPYVNGDISNDTYPGWSLFWEDYGYVGAATFLLAIYGGVRERRRAAAAYLSAMTVVAYLMVLGRSSPLFPVAYYVVPGLKLFRFPTRFLFVVELGLALLGGIGLTRLRSDLERWYAPDPPLVPRFLILSLCAFTILDLTVHQPRQNPMVPASHWLAAPPTVEVLRNAAADLRTFSPRHRDIHRRQFVLAHGWQDLSRYDELRDSLPPNTGGGYWGIPSADCYAGIAPSWYVDLWGDHNRDGRILDRLTYVDFSTHTVHIGDAVPNILRTFGVTHVLSPYALVGGGLPTGRHEGNAFIYPIEDAKRVRFVRGARPVKDDEDAIARLLDVAFDSNREVLLHDVPQDVASPAEQTDQEPKREGDARAVVTSENASHLEVQVDAPQDGFLLLADTFYPGWSAQVDGTPTPIYRANVAVRSVRISKGTHTIRFNFWPAGLSTGLRMTPLAFALLFLGLILSTVIGKRLDVDRTARSRAP